MSVCLGPREEAKVFQDRGIEHERLYLESLRGRGLKVSDLSSIRGTFQEKAAATGEAMADGADTIYQAMLFNNNLVGYPDFLRKMAGKDGADKQQYEVVDTKLAPTLKASHIVQLSFYSELLTELSSIFQSFHPKG